MKSKGLVIFLATIFVNFLNAERGIIPSPETCAALNEEYAIDPTRCQNSCEYYGRTWDCPISYKPNGDCYCKPGFARLNDGVCVSVEDNAECKAQLPITPESCSGPFEMFSEKVELGVCDINCRTYLCTANGQSYGTGFKWSPRCVCGNNEERYFSTLTDEYRRLSNGTCVNVETEECIAEYQPSEERCAALGLIYSVDAPCQPACYGEEHCPSPGPTCICPPNKLAFFSHFYRTPDSYADMFCYSKESCPKSTSLPRA